MMKEFHIQWHITNRCNLRCIHCYQENFASRFELDWNGLLWIGKNLIRTMKKWKVKLSLTLTGGEPLIKDELWKLLDFLSGQNEVSELNIITNGMLIDSYIDYIVDSPIKRVFVSLDGISSESNDFIRGKRSFKKIINNINLLRSQSTVVFVMFTLLNRNFEDAKGLLGFCENLSVDGYIIERFIPLGRGKKILNEVVSTNKLTELYQEIFHQCGAEYNPEAVAKYRALQVKYSLKGKVLSGAECVVGRYGLAILPQGEVLPCRRFYLPIGNLLREPLAEIWQSSEVLNKIRNRKNLEAKCGSCRVNDCYGCRAMVYALTGNYLAEDSDCIFNRDPLIERIGENVAK